MPRSNLYLRGIVLLAVWHHVWATRGKRAPDVQLIGTKRLYAIEGYPLLYL